ncbi:hypothetical protein DLJ53_10500 [Acuticoccus sediminis]|uniref:Uncharacterized protein n=1 Tax=Acuticoccus sediminis TaxID=2184697 RepID=A0A8B2P0N6_9HYPH|nr:hypothetical protein DLJ53_10500 [Acuticoccus sediminis]
MVFCSSETLLASGRGIRSQRPVSGPARREPTVMMRLIHSPKARPHSAPPARRTGMSRSSNGNGNRAGPCRMR